MLLFKRLATALVLFVILGVVVYIGTMAVGGGIMGAKLAARQQDAAGGFDEGFQIGVRAGAEFRRQYGPTVAWVSLGVAAVGATGLTFTGALPWCRRPAAPPPLPPATP